jgi:hypothetical protein
MRWAGHVTSEDKMRNADNISVEESQGNGQLERPKGHRMILKRISRSIGRRSGLD